jgi:hypothetical protein
MPVWSGVAKVFESRRNVHGLIADLGSGICIYPRFAPALSLDGSTHRNFTCQVVLSISKVAHDSTVVPHSPP